MSPVIKNKKSNPILDWGQEERSEHFHIKAGKITNSESDWGIEKSKQWFKIETDREEGKKWIIKRVLSGAIFLVIAILVLLVIIDPTSIPLIARYIIAAIYSIIQLMLWNYFGKR